MFVHKDSLYVHDVNPNVLIWKDHQTSKYPVDETTPNDHHSIYGVGKLAKDGCIYSADKILFGKLNTANIVGKPKGFVRFRITGIEFGGEDPENPMNFSGFEVMSYKGYSKPRADPMNRLIFQYRIRHDPLKIEDIAFRFQSTMNDI